MILAINCILFLKGFSKNERPFKIFALYNIAMLIVQITSIIFGKLHHNNLFLSHYYFIIQFLLVSFFYFLLFKENFQKKIIIAGLLICSVLLIVQYSLDFQLYYKFNLFEIFITSLPLIIYGTFHLYNLLNREKEFYYITIGLLIYLFGSTIVFLSANLLISLDSKMPFAIIYSLNVYLYFIYQLFILYDLIIINSIKIKI